MKKVKRGGVKLQTALCLASVMLTASSAFAADPTMVWKGTWGGGSYSKGSVSAWIP